MGKDLNGKELGKGISQRKDGLMLAGQAVMDNLLFYMVKISND